MTGPAALLDVNFLVALSWPNHVHHQAARTWFSRHSPTGWATTPVTEAGFVRVSSNPHIIPTAVTPATALSVLDRMCGLVGHRFWADSARLLDAQVDLSRLAAHRQVTDAHLIVVAAGSGGRLVTFDTGIPQLLRPADRHLVEVVRAPS